MFLSKPQKHKMNCQKSSLKEFLLDILDSKRFYGSIFLRREEATKTEKVDNLLAQLEEQRKAMMHVRKPGDFSSQVGQSWHLIFKYLATASLCWRGKCECIK